MTKPQRPLPPPPPLPAFGEAADDVRRVALPTPEPHLYVLLWPDCRTFGLKERVFEISVVSTFSSPTALFVCWNLYEVAPRKRLIPQMDLSYDSNRSPAIFARMGVCQRTGGADEDPREVAAQVLRVFI
mgnify:CR=1 FL=1